MLLLLVMLLLQLRPVQTYLAQQVLQAVSDKTNYEISISKVKISWLDQASLEEIMIKDLSGDTMVYSHNLEVNYEILNLIKQDFLNIEEVVSSGLRLKLAKHEEGTKLNLTQFLNALKTDTVKKESKPIYVGGITLSDLNLSLRDKTKELQPNKLDFANLNFRIPDFNVTRFSLRSDTISGEILQMRGVETHSNFTITDFNTVFRVSNQSLSVDDLNFRTPTSHVSDSLEFFYNGLDDLGYFQDSVSFILHFDNTVISNEDIRIVTGIKKLNNDISIDGIIWGTVGDFNIEQTRFGYGNSYFVGGVSCFGLPDLSKTFILADFTDSHLIPNDLRPYLGNYTDNLQRMGKIDFTGSFAGFLKDFVARGDFVTDQGSIHSDINIKIPADITNMSYVGNLEFKELNIGSFFKNEIVQVINLKAAVNGKGLKPENAEFDMKALVYNSGLYGYVYDSVEADGRFARNFFDGNFAIKDPNCDMQGRAQLDLRNDKEIVNVNIKIDTFNADKLNLTKKSLSVAGHITTEVNDLSLDNFNGNLKIDSGFVRLGDKHIILDSIRLDATLVDSTRRIELAFPGFESQIKGDFKVSELIKDVPAMASAYTSKLMLSDDTLSRVESGSNYKVDLYAKIKDISPYLDSLSLPVSLSGKTTIDGTFRQSKNSNLFFYVRSDTLEIKNNIFLQPRLELNGSRDLEDGSILTNLIFQSSDQVIAGVPNTKDLLIEGVWYKNSIDLTSQISQPETESDIRLESTVSLFKDSLIFRMLPSDIRLLDDRWRVNRSNKIVISNNKIEIENFEIYDSLESLTIEGVYADSIPTSITVSTEDLKMDKLGLFSKATIAGFLNGEFRMFRSTSNEPFKFDGGFLLRDLQYDNMDIGDVSGTSNWNPNEQSIYSKVEVKHENFNEVIVEGNYYPLRDNDQLDFNITFNEADLKLGQPFLEENLSNISGKANGSLQVTGTTNMPKVVGECQIENGGLTINYLNTSYAIDGKVDFNSDQIKLINFNLTDRKGSNATMSGTIYHSSFKNLRTEITMRANNFEFLNTTSLDNELYYGSAYGSGTINVTGPLNDLLINASIRTEPNTRFFIPIADATSTSQQDYISFVDFSDTTEVENKEEEFSLSGLTLEFDIDVTPDAYCELIFDIKTGDIIRGRGRGNLKLRLDTDGEFNMFGPLEITEGAYNFTVPNFINKEFDVVPGSRITWYGEPYDAILDLEATYLQRASFEELDNPEDRNAEELAIKVPVLVVLELDGSMLSPDIGFDLRLENQSDATPRSTADLAQITSDEQELKRQVISLLFLKRFSPRQSFQLGGGSVGNSVSEFLSSQVSYLVSQIDENLEVEVDLADLNRDAFNTFQLRFAYTFLNGRLKVTRGGDFGSQGQNQTDDNVLNDIVGDWSVEYSLTKDGKLRAKVFSNTDQRIIATEQQNQETGISLRFVHSFNDITELLSLKREEALLRREEEENEKAEDNKAPDSTR